MSRHIAKTLLASAASVLALSACAMAPLANLPAMEAVGEFRGRWTPAQPSDQQRPSPWWTVFGDPALAQLEEEALRVNPDVAVAMARLKQARALTARSAAARFPTVDAGFGATRQRSAGADATAQTLWRAQASVAYEADLFGRVAAGVAAARADAAQQQALAHQMLLLVQADVARTYFSLRQLESEKQLLRETLTLWEDTVTLLEHKAHAGNVAAYVVDQARTELHAARSEELAIARHYALTLHAMAILLGKTPSAFALAAKPLDNISIALPAAMPSTLLERRPDIAAAERAMAAENARVGVAQAAFFPSFSLTGAFGYESAELSDLGRWTQRTFLLGPLVGTALSLPLFDGGRRRADLDRARGAYEERVAEYRKAVLQAFREVEDALVSMRTLGERIAHQRAAQQSASRVAVSAKARFDEGDVDYLVVVDAERTLLRSRQLRIQSEGEHARAVVDFIRALGGGWAAPGNDESAVEG